MASIRDRLTAARAAWKAAEPTPTVPPRARPGPQRRYSRLPMSSLPHRLRPARPQPARIKFPPTASPEPKPDKWQRLIAVGSILSVLVLAAGLYYTNEANREQQRLTAQGQITDRFTRAVEQLGRPGPEKIDVRLGAIYALERIMRDSAVDQAAVVEVLAAFVRVHSPNASASASPPRTPVATSHSSRPPVDIQAAATVLARRDPTHDRQGDRLNLVGADLGGAVLIGAHFDGADLMDANLADANLRDAHLSGANLANADLTEANLGRADLTRAYLESAEMTSAWLLFANLTSAGLYGADLTDAHLGAADLSRANLDGATLTRAGLSQANLNGTDLDGADLDGANLTDARNVTSDQVQCTRVNVATQLPATVRRPTADILNDPVCRFYLRASPTPSRRL